MAELVIELGQILRDAGCTQALLDVARERVEQVTREGWTPEHDNIHTDRSLARAAATYAVHYAHRAFAADDLEAYQHEVGAKDDCCWPDDWEFKPKNPRRDLVRAAALLLAEIERLDRSAPPTNCNEADSHK